MDLETWFRAVLFCEKKKRQWLGNDNTVWSENLGVLWPQENVDKSNCLIEKRPHAPVRITTARCVIIDGRDLERDVCDQGAFLVLRDRQLEKR